MNQTSFKPTYNIYKIDPLFQSDLLQKYNQASSKFRDESFTQQAELFLSKISTDRKISKELRVKFPLYHILMAISKIFLLNEYEITNFACIIDQAGWKYDDFILPDEHSLIADFPISSRVELNSESRRLILYLMMIAFYVKQCLNEKSDTDMVQAYLEKICPNFTNLYNRWARILTVTKLNYSFIEANKKFKYLAQKDNMDSFNTLKDYNIIAENIMTLTGSYSGKGTQNQPVENLSISPPKTSMFTDINSNEYPKNIYFPDNYGLSKQLSKSLDFFNEQPPVRIPNIINTLPRQQQNFPVMLQSVPVPIRPLNFDNYEDPTRKKFKTDEQVPLQQLIPQQKQENNGNKQQIEPENPNGGQSNMLGPMKPPENEDLLYSPLQPGLMRKNSTLSQNELEPPQLGRFSSNLSFLYDK